MLRFGILAVALLVFAAASQAHFVFVVPDARNPDKAKVVFSDELAPDENVPIDKIATIKLHVRDDSGKDQPVATVSKTAHALIAELPGKGKRLIYGSVDYGVLQKGDSKPFLLRYHPKAVVGSANATRIGDKLPIEVIPVTGEGKIRFQILSKGKPLADAEATVMLPNDGKKEKVTTDKEGLTPAFAAAGRYGVWTRATESAAGELDGKKYEEIRNYATLVVDFTPQATLPPLPKGTTSFGAAVNDGYVYFYGGHTGKPHSYSTETTVGKFYRLPIAKPVTWEELSGGPAAQGTALVAHAGKIYRIGGMQPRNKPDEKTDTHSLASAACFDPKSSKWQDLPEMPAGRSSHDAVVLGDAIYVAGGWQMNGAGKESVWHKTALVLDLQKSPLKWETIEQPFQRRALTMAACDGKIFVVAGLNADGTAERTVNVFDPKTKTWSKGPDIPQGTMNGFTPAACTCDGRLFLSPADGKVYRLAEKGDAWEEVAALTLPRVVHRMVPIGKATMLVLGGSAKGAPTPSVEVIEIRK